MRHRERVGITKSGNRQVLIDAKRQEWSCPSPGTHTARECTYKPAWCGPDDAVMVTNTGSQGVEDFHDSYECMIDDVSYHIEEVQRFPSRYRGRKPAYRPKRYRWVRDNRESKWSYHPLLHIRKQVGKGRGVKVRLSHCYEEGVPQQGGIYVPGMWSFHYSTDPEYRFYDPASFGVAPVSLDSQSRFMSKGDFTQEHLATLRRMALLDMVPNMENGFSLPVFIGELKDLPRMIGGLLAGLQGLLKFLGNLLTRPLKTLSKSHLSAIYGWLPFQQDVHTIVSRLVNLRKDVDNFLEHAGTRNTFHWGHPLDKLYYKPEEFFYSTNRVVNLPTGTGQTYEHLGYFLQGCSFDVVEDNHVEDFEYHATMEFVYNVPEIGTLAFALAALDRFGLNLSVSDIWELVPFSFVVDWFFNVQSVLARFNDTNLPVQIVINDFCDSIKFKYTEANHLSVNGSLADSRHKADGVSHFCQGGWTVSPLSADLDYIEDAYYRWRTIPVISTEDFPNLTTPKGFQLVNGLALILARI